MTQRGRGRSTRSSGCRGTGGFAQCTVTRSGRAPVAWGAHATCARSSARTQRPWRRADVTQARTTPHRAAAVSSASAPGVATHPRRRGSSRPDSRAVANVCRLTPSWISRAVRTTPPWARAVRSSCSSCCAVFEVITRRSSLPIHGGTDAGGGSEEDFTRSAAGEERLTTSQTRRSAHARSDDREQTAARRILRAERPQDWEPGGAGAGAPDRGTDNPARAPYSAGATRARTHRRRGVRGLRREAADRPRWRRRGASGTRSRRGRPASGAARFRAPRGCTGGATRR